MNTLQQLLPSTNLSAGKITPKQNWTPQGATGLDENWIHVT